MVQLLRFADLKAMNIVRNRVTLRRWVEKYGFPPGMLLGPATRAWRLEDVERWLTERARASGQEAE